MQVAERDDGDETDNPACWFPGAQKRGVLTRLPQASTLLHRDVKVGQKERWNTICKISAVTTQRGDVWVGGILSTKAANVQVNVAASVNPQPIRAKKKKKKWLSEAGGIH